MRKIRIYDKDLNEKGLLTPEQLDSAIEFGVTENGWGDLDFNVVGDTNIEHTDVIKVIEPGEKIREYYNHRFIDFDGSNDYARSGKSINLPRRDLWTNGTLTRATDGNGDYTSGFNSANWIDVGGVYSDIAIDKPFSIKVTVETPSTGTGCLLDFGPLQFFYQSGEIRVGFLGGNSRSHAIAISTYARCVITYDGAGNFALSVNGTIASGTNAVSGTNNKYCWIGNSNNRANPRQGRWYGLCLWDVVLTSGEITAENGAHAPVKTGNRIGKWDSTDIAAPSGSPTIFYDQIGNIKVIDDGIVSSTLLNNTHIAISIWIKNDIDATDTPSAQTVILTPYYYIHIRNNTNKINVRYDNSGSKVAEYSLGNGDRARHHIVATVYNNGTNWINQLRVDGILRSTNTNSLGPSVKYTDYIQLGLYSGAYYNGKIGPTSIYTFTGSFVGDDAIRMYKGLEPISTTAITLFTAYNMQETSGIYLEGLRPATLYNSPTRISQNDAPFARYEDKKQDNIIYYGQVINITPSIQARKGKRTSITALGIQTTLNDIYFRSPSGTRTWNSEGSGGQLYYPNEIIQYVLDQSAKYIDYEGKYNLITQQDFRYQPNANEGFWKRHDMYTVEYNIGNPFGINEVLPLVIRAQTAWVIENVILKSGVNVQHIIQFWAKTQSGTGNITISYGIYGDAFFTKETYNINTTRKRISVNVGRGSPSGGGIMRRITSSTNMRFYDFKAYEEQDGTLQRFGLGVSDIAYNNTKLIQARQDAIEYGGGKVKRNEKPYIFNPDINNTPDHYISEEKHCSYIDKGVNSDEIRNSIEVERDAGITATINDNTSISTYRRREETIVAKNISNNQTAVDYGNIYLAQNKDPKVYAKAVVTRAYPIGTLRVGDLVQINGNTLQIARGYITRLDMREKDCTIYIGNYDGLGKILSLYK